MHNAQLTIITAIITTMLMAACTADTEPTNQTATVTIAATAQQFLPSMRGGGSEADGGVGTTRATTDIKTNFLPGDEITIDLNDGTYCYYQYTTAATWEPTGNALAFPLSPTAPITLTAKYPTGPDPLTATASTADGTITLTIDPTTGQPQWNIALSFAHQKAVVDVIVMDPQMNIITHLMQSVTINNNPTSNTPTNILMPTTETITKVRVVVAGITYDAPVNPAATLAANTRYTIAFICNPTKPTVTINTTGPNWTEGETGTVPAGYHYYIYNSDDLQAWAGDTKGIGSDRKAIQMANIEWNAAWTPINFSGTYNGNGHTITGLNISTTSNSSYGTCSGMFGYVGGNAILTGIHLRGQP